jgi:hypothetical protein
MAKQPPQSVGLGVDAQGGPVIDPTQNVLDLVAASITRQDDLRERDREHAKELAALTRGYEAELRKAETNRIDAIRLVDTGNVARTAETNAAAASALAAQLVATAEQNRTQVASAAAAAVTSLAAALEPIQKDIRDLRDAQARGVGGKEQIVEHRSEGGENRAWVGIAIAVAAVFSSVILGIAGIAITLLLKG